MESERLGLHLSLLAVPALAVLISGRFFIDFLRKRYLGQYIREDGPQSHQSKKGTPTMGGLLIWLGVVAGFLLVYFTGRASMITNDVGMVLLVTGVFAALGFWDDYAKITKKHNKGVTGYTKLAVQVTAGLVVGLYMMWANGSHDVTFFNLARFDLGWFYPLFAIFIITGASNAVNLTDGLDGLAASTMLCSLFAFILVFMGISISLGKPGLVDAGFLSSLGLTLDQIAPSYPDLAMFCLILMGSLMGFLFYNLNPAKIFMGDTGSLALGGALGTLAIVSHSDLWLALIGGIFVLETLSVILQVASFKLTGKRIFKMSPLHHHFELCGWHETKVVSTFVIVQFLLCAIAIFLYNKA